MPKLLEFETSLGPVLVQAATSPDEVAAIGRVGDLVEKVSGSIGHLFAMVSGMAQDFAVALGEAPVESAELEFGLQFTAKGRLYVAESEGQAAIRVKLTVRPDRGAAPARS